MVSYSDNVEGAEPGRRLAAVVGKTSR